MVPERDSKKSILLDKKLLALNFGANKSTWGTGRTNEDINEEKRRLRRLFTNSIAALFATEVKKQAPSKACFRDPRDLREWLETLVHGEEDFHWPCNYKTNAPGAAADVAILWNTDYLREVPPHPDRKVKFDHKLTYDGWRFSYVMLQTRDDLASKFIMVAFHGPKSGSVNERGDYLGFLIKDFRDLSEENGRVPVIFGGDFNLQHASAKERFEIATDDGAYGFWGEMERNRQGLNKDTTTADRGTSDIDHFWILFHNENRPRIGLENPRVLDGRDQINTWEAPCRLDHYPIDVGFTDKVGWQLPPKCNQKDSPPPSTESTMESGRAWSVYDLRGDSPTYVALMRMQDGTASYDVRTEPCKKALTGVGVKGRFNLDRQWKPTKLRGSKGLKWKVSKLDDQTGQFQQVTDLESSSTTCRQNETPVAMANRLYKDKKRGRGVFAFSLDEPGGLGGTSSGSKTNRGGAVAEQTKPTPTKTATNRRKKDPNKPRRPVNAFIWYKSENLENMRKLHPTATLGELSRLLGAEWSKIKDSPAGKKYRDLAGQNKIQYKKEMTAYKGAPDKVDEGGHSPRAAGSNPQPHGEGVKKKRKPTETPTTSPQKKPTPTKTETKGSKKDPNAYHHKGSTQSEQPTLPPGRIHSNALLNAARVGDLDEVNTLIARGASVEARDSRHGNTPLIWAADEGHTAIVNALAGTYNANVEAVDNNGTTALMSAAANGHIDTVNALAGTYKANVDAVDEIGVTALIYAAGNGHTDTVNALVGTHNANVDAADMGGMTALIWAAFHGHTDTVNALAGTHNANVEAVNDDGWTALMWAAREGHTATVNALAGMHNANVEAVDDDGWTALMWAAREGHTDIVAALRRHGATR